MAGAIGAAALCAAAGLWWHAEREREATPRPFVTVRAGLPEGHRSKPTADAKRAPAPFHLGTFRGGASHSGRSTFLGPIQANLRWKFDARARITAQPVLSADGQTVYVGTHKGEFLALSARGGLRWKRNVQDKVYGAALVGEQGTLYVGSDAGVLWAFSPKGDLRWRLSTDGDADTAPVQGADGAVYFTAGPNLYAVDPSGQERWRFRTQGKLYSSPAIATDGTVYVGSQDDHLYAVAATGTLRWRYRTRGDVDSPPTIGQDGTIYVGSDDQHVYALWPDGRLRWASHVMGYVRAPLALGRRGELLVHMFGPRPSLLSLDSRNGTLRWRFALTFSHSSEEGSRSGVLVDAKGDLYFGGHDDYLYALRPDGKLRWVFGARGNVDSSPVLGPDGTLYVGADDGFVYALRGPTR